MKKSLMVIPLVILLCFTFGCQQGEEVAEEMKLTVDIEAEKANVKAVLNQYVTAWNSLDADMYLENFCQDEDMVIFSSIPTVRIVGWDAWKEAVISGFKEYESAEVSFRDELIKVHVSGDGAWLTCYLDLNFVSQGKEGSAKGIRTTWVLEKRNDKWVIVHAHWSLPSVA